MNNSFSEFHLRTSISSGAGARSLLPQMIQGLGGKRVILFTDKGLVQAGVAAQILDLFKGIEEHVELVGVFDEIEQDAKAENVTKAVRFFREHQADALIALGGGSVLDAVKGIKWMLHKGYDDTEKVLHSSIREFPPEAQPTGIPHVAIPTTAGTGAEVSPMAVIYNEKLGMKLVIRTPYLNADMAILDPELTVGLPPKITAFTGMDALTHAIEGYFSTTATPFTDSYALYSTHLIAENLPIAVKEGSNLEARGNMLMASAMAITAFGFGNNGVPVHNMAHVFGAKFRIPHGLANAVLLPNMMVALPSLYLPKIKRFAEALGIENLSSDPQECLTRVIEFILNLRQQIGLPDTFAEFNLDSNMLQCIVDEVQSDSASARFLIPADVITKVTEEVSGLTSSKVNS
ncbi:iron-containing alcohol dehydrogenase [Peribacillus frigoritolerans]|uniref:Iron-containing alcohol dehydrogenase n=1 Tax=Peribacillus frigoritolerans TaxID=450367 RepID=A0AAJ1V9E7_9BACI|nr:iron-containing alcohol dehydrogenase [Peribacillus frigoritolerans]MDM5281894.1 iron-containing alcohol dehydrogenase [Peribacillus frigoritolerans]